MSAFINVHIVHTRTELTSAQKSCLSTILRAGLEVPTIITESEFNALHDKAVALNINDGFDVWVCKKSGKNNFQIIEDPIVAPEPVVEPEPIIPVTTIVNTDKALVNNKGNRFRVPDDDEWGNITSASPASIVPATPVTIPEPAKIPTPKPTVTPGIPTTPPVAYKTPQIPPCIVYVDKPSTLCKEPDMSEKAEIEIALKILQNSTLNNLSLKNFISNHMLESKIATRIIDKCLRHNSDQPVVTLTDDEQKAVNEMKRRIITRMGLKKTFKGNGYTIPVQSMTEYGQKYYSQFIYEETALRMRNGETPKFMFIINVADKSIVAKTFDESKEWACEFNEKTFAFINSRCNLKGYTKIKRPSVNAFGKGGI